MFPLNFLSVLDSKDDRYPINSYVWGFFGWRDLTIFNRSSASSNDPNYIEPYIVENIAGIPIEIRLGALGMTGVSAYYGFLEVCQPKAGDIVVISGAAGAVGNLVGQMAKLRNCTVIGIAGRDDKCNWIKHELGFDAAINYKNENVDVALAKYAPSGVDIYFDNVGGELSQTVYAHLNRFARVCVCGAISTYNAQTTTAPKIDAEQKTIDNKQLHVVQFMVSDWFDRWSEGVKQLAEWIINGHIKYRHTISKGFENLPAAFIGMLCGQNIGKALVAK